MESEDRHRVQVLSSHDIEVLRKFLAEKANDPLPQPDTCMIGGVVRAVFPQLCELRRKGYSLSMLVRMLEEKGVKITSTSLSGYMKKLSRQVEETPAIAVAKSTSRPSTCASHALQHPVMKPDVSL